MKQIKQILFLKRSYLQKNVIFIFIFFLQFLHAQDSSNTSFVFLPAIYHTPETKLAYGAFAQYNYREPDSPVESRPSSFTPILIFTQKKQFIGELQFDLYLKKETYHLTGVLTYKIYPNLYYGIGNNTPKSNEESYSSNDFITSLTFLKKIHPSINLGLRYDFENSTITKKDSLLKEPSVLGNKGGIISGAGPVVHFDTRDNIHFPSKGYFYQASLLFYPSFFGSDFSYRILNIELMKYYTFFKQHILAFHSYIQFTDGDVPFNKLSQIGGSRILRGYFTGRYIDNHIIFFQGEYRSPTWFNMGYVAFAGLGEVAPQLDKFDPADFKYSIGFGFRYMFIPKEKVNLRFDFGFVEGGFEFYANIGEAF